MSEVSFHSPAKHTPPPLWEITEKMLINSAWRLHKIIVKTFATDISLNTNPFTQRECEVLDGRTTNSRLVKCDKREGSGMQSSDEGKKVHAETLDPHRDRVYTLNPQGQFLISRKIALNISSKCLPPTNKLHPSSFSIQPSFSCIYWGDSANRCKLNP